MQMHRFIIMLGLLLVSVPLAAQEFGKNKVQYRTFDWKFIQSENFDIYYYDEAGYNLASFTAHVAQGALPSLETNLRYRLPGRISLIVYNSKNDFQQTNVVGSYMPEGVGGVTELFKNRVVVPFEGDWEKFRHVIHHELVHAVLNEKFYGGSIMSIITNNIQTELPLWMNEGLAEFEAYDGYNVETDMFIRDAVIGEYMPELYELGGYFAYRGGQAFYWYVAENYGRAKIGELLDRVRTAASLDEAFRGAFDKGIEEFSEQFLYDLKKIYWPDIADRRRPRDFATALTDHREDEAFFNMSPAISPDGSRVVFISDRDGPRSVYIRDVEGDDEPEELIEGERNIEFEELHILTPAISWSPDSRRVAIAVKSKGRDAIFLVDVESGDKERIAIDLDAIYSVDWSRDGSRLTFQGIKGDRSDIYIYAIASRRLENLTDDIYSDFDPQWSEDGATVAFLSDRRDNPIRRDTGVGEMIWDYPYDQVDIYTIDAADKTLRRITNDAAREKSPVPGPDGRLFYISDANGIDNIYLSESAGGPSRPLTNSITAIEQISITPDGSRMVFSAWNGEGYDVFLLRSPLDERIDGDTLAPTTFVQRTGMTAETVDDAVTVETEGEIIGYGEVEIELDEPVTDETRVGTESSDDTPRSARPPVGAVDSTGMFTPRDYKVRFTNDVVQATGGYNAFYGFQGLMQALFSDELGDHQIYLATNLQTDLQNSDFLLNYSYLAKPIDYHAALSQEAILLRIGTSGDIVRFRQIGGSFMASKPLSRFRRIELGVTGMNIRRENVQGSDLRDNQSKILVMPEARMVFDNTETLLLSPMLGTRYHVTATGSPKLGDDGVGFVTGAADFRHYIPLDRLGLFNIATRFTGAASFGPDPQQFFIGGMDGMWINSRFADQGIPIEDAEDYSLLSPVFPLRGTSWGESTGSKYGLVNLELRVPLLYGGGGLLASIIPYLGGTVFIDAGAAWNDELSLTRTLTQTGETVTDDLLMSAGIGLRAFLFGYPVRVDFAWPYDIQQWGPMRVYFSLGADF